MSAFKGLRQIYPYYVANRAVTKTVQQAMAVTDKYTGKVATHVSLADAATIDTAIQRGVQAEKAMRELPSYQRQEILSYVANEIRQRSEEFAHTITIEMGKPIRDARVEVSRAVDVFAIAAEEATRRIGEYTHFDFPQRNKGFSGITSRFPVGLVSCVTPFNFPLMLAAHKVAPAIAAGCPFVLKPAERTPIVASMLGEILAATSLPEGAFSVLPCTLENAHHFSTDERIKAFSFTGSVDVGWRLKNMAGKKKVTLELGGDAAVVLDRDCADLEYALDRITFGAFYQAGQACISVQRVYVHEDLYDAVKAKLVDRASKLKRGPPSDPETFVGPLIAESEARRVETWVNEAVSRGATLAIGGKRDGNIYEPTIVENLPKGVEMSCKEVFGPVFAMFKFKDFAEVCDRVNDSRFGLQAGIFTTDANKIFYAYNNLQVGGVLVNEIPSIRMDNQPYGGVKDSGFGREGVRYAIDEFSELKVLLMKNVGLLPGSKL